MQALYDHYSSSSLAQFPRHRHQDPEKGRGELRSLPGRGPTPEAAPASQHHQATGRIQ